MKVRINRVLLLLMATVAGRLFAQAPGPNLSNIETPYPPIQRSVQMGGFNYGAGAVAYGPVGTPLVISGYGFGAQGTVLFTPVYKNGSGVETKGTPVQATVSMWTSSILFVTVPAGAVSGQVSVNAEGSPSNALPFVVTQGVYKGSCPAFPPSGQLEITTSALPNGQAGQAYTAQLHASGGTPPYTWSLSGNTPSTLPSGLSLAASTGVISGTPMQAYFQQDIGVKVTDSSSLIADGVFSLVIDDSTLNPGIVYYYSVPAGGFDNTGNLLNYSDSVMGMWASQYDDLKRLMFTYQEQGSIPSPTPGPYFCFDYDSFGNRTQADLQTAGCNPNPAPSLAPSSYDPSTASYNAANHITWLQNQAPNGLSYDGSGNVTYDGVNYYAYDGEGRMCAIETWPASGGVEAFGYLYDADGRRVAKGTVNAAPLGQAPSCDPSSNGFTLTESYVLGQGGERLTAFSWTGGTSTWENTNVYAEGKLIATYDSTSVPGGQPTPALHFQLADPLGTRRVQTNAAGQAELDCQSMPFGDQLYCYPDEGAPAEDANEDATGSMTSIHFTGKDRDSESGNDYFGARYYASSMGRFMSPDFQDDDDVSVLPIPTGTLTNPQTLNLYSFTQNNPLRLRDYDGHASWQDCADGSGDQCWTGDYNGEQNNGLFWNSQTKQWQGSDPNPPPDSDPAGMFFTGLTRAMLGQNHGYSQMGRALMLDGPTMGLKSLAALIPFARPAFVPANWQQKELKKGDGVKYVDPNNPHNQVLLEKAKPGSSNPGQQVDYMKVLKNGQWLDANGNEVNNQTYDSHIPQGVELPPDTFGPIP